MTTMTMRVETTLDAFSRQPGVTEHQANILREAVATSPLLAKQMDRAVESGLLEHIDLLPESANSGGLYNRTTKTVSLNPGIFSGDDIDINVAVDKVTFYMGHEVQHAHLDTWLQVRQERFRNAVNNTALSGDSPHDHTDNAMIMMKAYRSTETAAEVAGWNALQDRIRFTSGNKHVNRQVLLQRADPASSCVSTNNGVAKLEPGLTLETDGQLRLKGRPENSAAMFTCFFNREPQQTRLGFLGRSDYPNYYGAGILSQIAQTEQYHNGVNRDGAPEVRINLKKLGLDHATLLENGVDLDEPGRTFNYLEINHQGQAVAYRQLRQLPHGPTITVTPRAVAEHAPDLQAPTSAHPLIDALRPHLPPETSPDRLAQIALAARTDGVTADTLQGVHVDGTRLHVIGSVPGFRGSIDLGSAPPPQAESMRQMHAHDQQQAQELEQFRERQAQLQATQDPALQPGR